MSAPPQTERRALAQQMRREGNSYSMIGRALGISKSAAMCLIQRAEGYVPRAIVRAPFKPPVLRTFCQQCDRMVRVAEAEQCASQWCKARAEAA